MRSFLQLSVIPALVAASTVAATLLVGATALAQPAVAALDLTGTWQGKSKCDAFDGAKFTVVHDAETLLINRTTPLVATYQVVFAIDGGFQSLGIVYTDLKNPDKKAQMGFVECSTTTDPATDANNQVGRAFVTAGKAPKATLKWTSTFENGSVIGTCKGTYKRIDQVVPSLTPGCAS